ncbi:MAG: hypothetical protein IIV50_06125 [Muribaculaceae bacterium]|nr:hypothetical protein [Muribaculaceae bacterium]
MVREYSERHHRMLLTLCRPHPTPCVKTIDSMNQRIGLKRRRYPERKNRQ